jgi:hypothetical protein
MGCPGGAPDLCTGAHGRAAVGTVRRLSRSISPRGAGRPIIAGRIVLVLRPRIEEKKTKRKRAQAAVGPPIPPLSGGHDRGSEEQAAKMAGQVVGLKNGTGQAI